MKGYGKKVIALFLCMVLMTSLLTACGTKKEEVSSDKEVQTEKEGSVSADTEGGAEPENDVLTELTLPLCEEKQELSVWTLYLNPYAEDPNEIAGVQKMEELTNVHINWSVVGYQEIAEKFGLMLASGDIADIIYAAAMASYPGGDEKAVQDGIYMDVTDLVEKYMPNYRELRTSTEQLARDTMTDSGRLVAVYGILSDNENIVDSCAEWTGLAIRKDMLDSWGLAVPETIQEWHDVLVAARDNGVEAPLLTGTNGYSDSAAFMSAYGVLPEFYQENGVVKYGPAEPGYKEWVQLFHDWYAERLIDPNFVSTMAGSFSDPAYTITGRSFAFPTLTMFTADGYFTNGYTDNADINVAAVPNPVLNAGDTPMMKTNASPVCGNPTYISANCKNPELAAKWLDYQMTIEGMFLNFYGVEGMNYEMEDGEPVFLDVVMNNPDYPTANEALSVYARGNGLGRYSAVFEDYYTIGIEKFNVGEEIWTNQDTSKNISANAALTDEEGSAFNSTYIAVQTLVNEMTTKFIMGSESLDQYEAFVDKLYDYGLEECIGYKQAALDRYNQRGK